MAPRVQRDRIVPVVATLAAHGPDRALTTVAGAGPDGLLGDLRLSLTTAASANLVDHLPAYLAMEPVADNTGHRLMLLLIGVNFGCLLTLWGSLATPLWRERCHAAGTLANLPAPRPNTHLRRNDRVGARHSRLTAAPCSTLRAMCWVVTTPANENRQARRFYTRAVRVQATVRSAWSRCACTPAYRGRRSTRAVNAPEG